MRLVVVLLQANGEESIKKTLFSLRYLAVGGMDTRLVLVRNNTDQFNPDLQYEIPTFLKPIVITNPTNYGLSEGYNVGIRKALEIGCDLIWILGSGVSLTEVSLGPLLVTLRSKPRCGIVASKIYTSMTDKTFWYAGGMLDWNSQIVSFRGRNQKDVNQFDVEVETDFVPYNSLLARSKVFQEVGVFNRNYFFNFFDIDFCESAKYKGWKIVFVPESIIEKTSGFEESVRSDIKKYFSARNGLQLSMSRGPMLTKLFFLRTSLEMLKGTDIWQKKGVLDFFKGEVGSGPFQSY